LLKLSEARLKRASDISIQKPKKQETTKKIKKIKKTKK